MDKLTPEEHKILDKMISKCIISSGFLRDSFVRKIQAGTAKKQWAEEQVKKIESDILNLSSIRIKIEDMKE